MIVGADLSCKVVHVFTHAAHQDARHERNPKSSRDETQQYEHIAGALHDTRLEPRLPTSLQREYVVVCAMSIGDPRVISEETNRHMLKIREGGSVQPRACYLALGITVDGERDVLGVWFQETEGANFWMQVLAELKQRGVQDILICCVDGLKAFPEAIEAIFPNTTVQTCIVHLLRHSLRYVPRREREQVAGDLKPIYTAVDADAAQHELERFDENWGERFPVITQAWLNAWEYVIPFLAFPEEVRRVIYTTECHEERAFVTWGERPSESVHCPKGEPHALRRNRLGVPESGLVCQEPQRRDPQRGCGAG